MSHVAKIDLVIHDLNALSAACSRMGLELVRGQTTFKWYGKWMDDYASEDAAFRYGIKPEDYGKCVHAIRIADPDKRGDAYEVGLLHNPDQEVGGFLLIYDFFSNGKGMGDYVGDRECNRIKQEYGAVLVEQKMKLSGAVMSSKKTLDDGRQQMKFNVM